MRTDFVGEGATISITVKGSRSKKIVSFDDKIYGNRFTCAIPLPADLEVGEDVWFEVKLSKQKLKGKSNLIPAYPMPELIAMSWNQDIARRGDVLTLTAEFDRVQDNAEVTVHIYEYDQDGIHDPIAQIPTQLTSKKLELLWEYEYMKIPMRSQLRLNSTSMVLLTILLNTFLLLILMGGRFGEEQESGILGFREVYSAKILDTYKISIPNQKVKVHLSDGTINDLTSDQEGLVFDKNLLPGKFHIKIPQNKDGV